MTRQSFTHSQKARVHLMSPLKRMCELQRPVTQIPSILLFSIYLCVFQVSLSYGLFTYNEHEQRQCNNIEVKLHYAQSRQGGALHKLA